MQIGKTYTFEAAHLIPDHPQCGVVHGHSYIIEVTLEGPVSSETGMVLDFHKLNQIVRPIMKTLDHSMLNELMGLPTAERLALYIFGAIVEGLAKAQSEPDLLHSVKVQEGVDGGWAKVGA